VPPLLDQLVVASREAAQLAALPRDRIAPLLEASNAIRDELAAMQPPECLEEAHIAALEGASLLVQGLESIGSGDYSQAEFSVRSSFEEVARVIAFLAIQIWEATATSTPIV
jgi:hypothetical protein